MLLPLIQWCNRQLLKSRSSLPLCLAVGILLHAASSIVCSAEFTAQDTLKIPAKLSDDEQNCIAGFLWTPETFHVRIEPQSSEKRSFVKVRFPSPRPLDDEKSDLVCLEWYQVLDDSGAVKPAPAVVVIHESGRSMPVGRKFAECFQYRGIHAFMIQLPGYGDRRSTTPPDGTRFVPRVQQGVTDVRRAKDAIRALPGFSDQKISLQGTSLGGFVASLAGALDGGFENVFLMLSGGNIYDVLTTGTREAAKIHEMIKAAGLDDAEIKRQLHNVEPNRLAAQLNPSRTWLYSGRFDQVVPLKNAREFVQAANLHKEHHIIMPADHYSGILFLQAVVDQMAAVMLEIPVTEVRSPLNPSVQP